MWSLVDPLSLLCPSPLSHQHPNLTAYEQMLRRKRAAAVLVGVKEMCKF